MGEVTFVATTFLIQGQLDLGNGVQDAKIELTARVAELLLPNGNKGVARQAATTVGNTTTTYWLPELTLEPALVQEFGGFSTKYGPEIFRTPIIIFAPLRLHGQVWKIGQQQEGLFLGMNTTFHVMSGDIVEFIFISEISLDNRTAIQYNVYRFHLVQGTLIPLSIEAGSGSSRQTVKLSEIWRADSREHGLRLSGAVTSSQSIIPSSPILKAATWSGRPASMDAMLFSPDRALTEARAGENQVDAFFQRNPRAFMVDASYSSQLTTPLGATSLLWTMEWWGKGETIRFSVQWDFPNSHMSLPFQFATTVDDLGSNEVENLSAVGRDDMVTMDAAYLACAVPGKPFVFGYQDAERENRRSRVEIGGIPFRLQASYSCQTPDDVRVLDAYLGIIVFYPSTR